MRPARRGDVLAIDPDGMETVSTPLTVAQDAAFGRERQGEVRQGNQPLRCMGRLRPQLLRVSLASHCIVEVAEVKVFGRASAQPAVCRSSWSVDRHRKP